MKVDINLWAILFGGIASMAIGTIYYSPQLFAKEWMKLAKVDAKHFQKEMPKIMSGLFVAALVTAYVLAYITFLYHYFFQDSWLQAGVLTSLILWLGISATSIFIHNSVDQRPRMLTFLSLGNRLLSLLAMGLIIGWIHP
jgi:xanthine/uracil permease